MQAACTAAAPATPSPVCGAQATPPVTQMRQRTTWTGSCQRSRQVEAALPPPDGCVLATSSCTKLQQQSQRVCLCASLLTAWLVPDYPIVLGCSIMCCPASLLLECGKCVPIVCCWNVGSVYPSACIAASVQARARLGYGRPCKLRSEPRESAGGRRFQLAASLVTGTASHSNRFSQ